MDQLQISFDADLPGYPRDDFNVVDWPDGQGADVLYLGQVAVKVHGGAGMTKSDIIWDFT